VLAGHDTRLAWRWLWYGHSRLPGLRAYTSERNAWCDMLRWLQAHDPYYSPPCEEDEEEDDA
jgi:hypothetical protein